MDNLHNEDMEMQLLGILLLNASLLSTHISDLQVDLFYKTFHQHVITCMLEMYDLGESIDVATVGEYYHKKYGAKKDYDLTGLTESVVSAANVETYIETLKEKRLGRNLQNLSFNIQKQLGNREEPKEILESVSQKLLTIRDKENDATIAEQLHSLAQTITYRRDGNLEHSFWTGFHGIDRLMPIGMVPGDVMLVGARPSHGKTTLAIQMALHQLQNKKAVLFFSLEMGFQQIISKLICIMADISLTNFLSGRMTQTEFEAYQKAVGELVAMPLKIVDSITSMSEIRGKITQYKQQGQCNIVFLDYLQLIPCKGETRNEAIGELSRQFKRIAKADGLPVVLLSQLSRKMETEKREPQLADLRDSGSLEQDADKVILIYNPKPMEGLNIISKLILAKERMGEVGDCVVNFDRRTVKFIEV